MDQYEIAQLLREIGFMVELCDENPKKGLAYRRAANSLELTNDFEDLIKKEELESLPGIGREISKMISTLYNKNDLPYFHYLIKKVPSQLFELLNIPGISVKKIRDLYEKENITSIEDLKRALDEDRIKKISGFSPSFIVKLKNRINLLLTEGVLILFPKAEMIAFALGEKIKKNAIKFSITGSLRRKCETIDQLDFIAISHQPENCLNAFSQHFFVKNVVERSSLFVKIILKQGIKASLQIVEEGKFPFALLKSTGNHLHLEELDHELFKRKIDLTENYLKSLNIKNEEEIYFLLGLSFIPPEVREGYGEVEFAKKNDFSKLITLNDLKGVFHCHTLDSDGTKTIEEMVEGAKSLGWKYIGISDHSKSSYQARGLSEERLIAQIDQIKRLNHDLKGTFKIFSGLECDILPDGQLDFSNDLLKELDFVIVSVHSKFNQEKEVMTKRLIKAIENPYTTIIGHLSGRLLTYRDPYQIDVPKIIDACIANNKIIEINSYPSRLDMDWRWWAQSRDRGLKCSINPDAHSLNDFLNCKYGVNIARKGWLKKNDVINTLELAKMINFLKERKPG